jgi:hypothetical protein
MSVARTSLLLALAAAALCAPRAPAAGEDGPGPLGRSWRALVEAGTTAYQHGHSTEAEALRDGGEDWEREEAVAALTRLGAPVAPGALQQALHDRAFRVRWAARTALRALQPQH